MLVIYNWKSGAVLMILVCAVKKFHTAKADLFGFEEFALRHLNLHNLRGSVLLFRLPSEWRFYDMPPVSRLTFPAVLLQNQNCKRRIPTPNTDPIPGVSVFQQDPAP